MDSTMESFYWLQWISGHHINDKFCVSEHRVSCIVEQRGEGTLAEFTNNKSECSQSNRFRRTEDVIYVDGMDGMIV